MQNSIWKHITAFALAAILIGVGFIVSHPAKPARRT